MPMGVRPVAHIWLVVLVMALLSRTQTARAAITLENASPAAIACQITNAERGAPRKITIAVGESASIAATRPVEIQFRSGS